MKTASLILALFGFVLLASAITEPSPKINAPQGCVPAPKAKSTESGWADRVIHEKTGIELVFIPGGKFTMGSNSPAPYKVTIVPYYIGKTEVTNAQYRRFLKASGYDGTSEADENYDLYLRHFRGKSIMSTADDYPVVWVSWHNAKAFCAWAGLTLPSEARWEFACRAGTTSHYYFGESASKFPPSVIKFEQHSWSTHNSGGLTHPVARKESNAWGLYDMYGNVWEWAEDDFAYDHYPHPQIPRPTDGSARIEGRMTKSLRGGSWSNTSTHWISGSTGRYNSAAVNAFDNVGFRVMLPLK